MIRYAVAILLTITLWSTTAAAEWQPVEGRLMTRWAKDVSPDKAWPEYPRPQMVRQDWANLNGLWDYAIVARSEGQPAKWDGKILVPFAVESALSGVGKPVTPEQRLWYHRTFAAPKLADGNRLLLHFGAVDWQCKVWVNGKEVGEHEGGFDRFTFDVTDALHDGSSKDGENEIVVAVWDPTDTSTQPRGKQVLKPNGIWYTAVTGIWQTVWLEPVPAAHIDSLKIVPDVDASSVRVTANATGGKQVRVTARHGDKTATASGPANEAVEVKLDDPQLWSPAAPNLYDLRVELLDGDKVVDTVDSYCGLRKIEVKKDAAGANRLFLNDQALFQYGPLDQGWWPDGLYTPATDEAMKYDIEMTQKLGMNMARKHTKYECDRWYYWCDKLGLLVWQDMPSGDADKTPESRANYRRELKSMIDALHNYPSIVVWVPFNEGWGQFETPEVVAWIEKYDPTRPVNEASGWHDRGSSTISDMHNYPGPGMRPLEDKRAVVLGEFGGLGVPIEGHTWTDKENWGYVSYASPEELTDAYLVLMNALRPLVAEGLSAAVYTQTSDVEIEVNGLMTYDRQLVKMDGERIAAAARRLYEAPPLVRTLVPTSRDNVAEGNSATQWKYTFAAPADDWHDANFDDTAWQTGPAAFGTYAPAGGQVGTPWDTKDIWIRKTFDVADIPANEDTFIVLSRDEGVEIYLNGQLIAKRGGHEPNYSVIPLPNSDSPLLKPTGNTLAVRCSQTTGGQLIDVGLITLESADGG
ncbi:MAG: sugar-binding domain-containing protein [Pirellulales bacterium]